MQFLQKIYMLVFNIDLCFSVECDDLLVRGEQSTGVGNLLSCFLKHQTIAMLVSQTNLFTVAFKILSLIISQLVSLGVGGNHQHL